MRARWTRLLMVPTGQFWPWPPLHTKGRRRLTITDRLAHLLGEGGQGPMKILALDVSDLLCGAYEGSGMHAVWCRRSRGGISGTRYKTDCAGWLPATGPYSVPGRYWREVRAGAQHVSWTRSSALSSCGTAKTANALSFWDSVQHVRSRRMVHVHHRVLRPLLRTRFFRHIEKRPIRMIFIRVASSSNSGEIKDQFAAIKEFDFSHR